MAQCESKVFFPDNALQRPQFSECPRESVTRRRTWRFGDREKGEPMVMNSVVKLCTRCAREWDEGELGERLHIERMTISDAPGRSVPSQQRI
jgi:hypothetical protein